MEFVNSVEVQRSEDGSFCAFDLDVDWDTRTPTHKGPFFSIRFPASASRHFNIVLVACGDCLHRWSGEIRKMVESKVPTP